jgi:hypothetical protein
MMKKIYILLIALFAIHFAAQAQSGFGEIRGKVIDEKTKKPMDYVTVTAYLNGIAKASTQTDDEGGYTFKTLQVGEYSIKAYYSGYPLQTITDIGVNPDGITFVNVTMEQNVNLKEVVIKDKPALIRKDGVSGAQFNAAKIMALPQRNVNAVANLTAGVESRSGATPNIRGGRSENTAYYIDGIRVQGGSSTGIASNAIDQIQVITGGTPAQYGDFIGGAISITTKAPTKRFIRSIEYTTSTPFTGYLDNSQFNQLEGVLSGPLKIINKGKGDKERVLIGFLISTNINFARDGRLPATDIYKVNDTKLAELQARPLTLASNGSLVFSSEFLRKTDLEKVDYRQNVPQYAINLQGNFNFQPADNINIRLGYQGNYFNGRDYSYYNSLMNASNNPLRNDYTVRAYLQFTQTFNKKKDEEKDKKEVKGGITDAFYTVRVSYENRFVEVMDATHQKNFFDYGYIGQFKTYKAPAFERISKAFGQAPDTFKVNGNDYYLTSYWKQNSFRDTAYRFVAGNANPILANYTKTVYDLLGNSNIRTVDDLLGSRGLTNGSQPDGIYSFMWGNVGTNQASYSKLNNETYSAYIMSEASIAPKSNPKAKHDLQFGINIEQQYNRSYGLAATGLWTAMRQLANEKFPGEGNLDPSTAKLKFDANGVFQDTVTFDRAVADSLTNQFGENLRNKLRDMGATDISGRPIDSKSYIDVNSYNPNTFSLDMFSANDLLRNGVSSLVSYNGYDYLGNRVGGQPGIKDWIKNRALPAYQPTYAAAWFQDKFVFKDLILRLGVRVERFDANQPVLKDPFSLVPIYTAGDVKNGNIKGLASQIPSTIGNDYAVYVDRAGVDQALSNNNINITGFRSGDKWYDKNGNYVSDPNTLNKNYQTLNGQNAPLLVDPTKPETPTENSFKDYVPDVKVSPRVWFSFPISTTSQFFGTYDILTQRPAAAGFSPNNAQFDDYFFLQYRRGGAINNPDLKFTQVTDYEIGFRQQIGDNSSLGIIGSYREFKNLIQQYKYVQAWPFDYITYGNLDFSTVKSFRLEYELRDLGNVNISANYQLQFVEGTGSGTNTSGNLVNAGLGQLRTVFPLDYDTRHTIKGTFDFHYKDGKKYDGPVVRGKKIFENAGFNIIFNTVSGRPYTQNTIAVPEGLSGVSARSPIKGTINGSNLPAQFYTDLNVDKNFTFTSKKIDGRTVEYRMRIFLIVQNLFNEANVLGVYRYTGSAYSDGFITSPQAIESLRAATNVQSFVDLYNTRIVNPGNFALPRLTRFGIQLTF